MVTDIANAIVIHIATRIADLPIGTVAIALISGLLNYHNSSLCCILHGFSASNRQLGSSICLQWLAIHLFS